MSSDSGAEEKRLVAGEMLRLLLAEMSDLRCELGLFDREACYRTTDGSVIRKRLRSIDRAMSRVRKRIQVMERLASCR